MSKHTPGPWRWELNEKHKTVELCGGLRPTYDLTVMGFERWGMHRAAPMFRNDHNYLERAEVYGKVAPGRDHHADWFKLIDNPDANLIAAAPDLLAALKLAQTVVGDAVNGTFTTIGEDGPDGNIQIVTKADVLRRIDAAIAKAEG